MSIFDRDSAEGRMQLIPLIGCVLPAALILIVGLAIIL